MATTAPVARVSAVQGQAFAKDEKGNLRPLKAGDPIYEGEVLLTGAGSQVELATQDGRHIELRANEILTVDAEVAGDVKPGVTEAALLSGGKDADKIIQAIKEGGSIDELLEDTAAGNSAGGSDGGSSFVRLLRIAEGVDPLSFDFETARRSVADELLNDGNANPAPTIAADDVNGAVAGQATVDERGLTSGADTRETTTGTITVNAPGGLSSITVGGVTFTLAQLTNPAALAASPINTGTGTLTLTGYTPGTGSLGYTYTLNGAVNQPGATETTDTIALSVTSLGGTASGSLVIQIVDDVPIATDDSGALSEDTLVSSVSGNVLGNDTIGADVSVTPVAPTAGTISLTYGTLVLNANGAYTYTLDNSRPAVQALAQGQQVSDSFTYTITDADGDSSTATLILTITGTNDAPVITSGVQSASLSEIADNAAGENTTALTAAGTVSFNDVDSLDTHSATVTPQGAGYLGTLTLGAVNQTTDSIGWNFSVADGALDYLQAGQTLTQTYAVQVNDGHGGTATQNVTITITGTNDAPVATADSIGVTEDAADQSGLDDVIAATTVVGGNVLSNDTDADSGDTRSVTGVAPGTPGSASGNVATGVAGTYGSVTVAADGSYTYRLDNTRPAVQALAQGQTVTDTFTYTVTDSQGAQSSTTLIVTVTGSNDAPNVYVGSGDRSVAGLTETNAGLTTTGKLSVTDIDTTDQVSSAVNAVTVGGTYLALAGNVVPANSALLGMFSVSGGESSTTAQSAANGISWRFASGTEAFNQLPKGETLILTYTVRVTDTFGATDDQTVTITITGTNDTPVVTTDSARVIEDAADQSSYDDSNVATTIVAGNVLTNDRDVDTGDVIRVTGVAAGSPSSASGNVASVVAGTYGTVIINADGTYRYTLDDSKPAVQALRVGQLVTDTFTYTVTDTQGATRTTRLTVTVVGSNDRPDIFVGSGDSAAASLTESNVGLITGGTLSLFDVDTQDTVGVSKTGVSASGTYSGLSSLSSKISVTQLLNMLTVAGAENSTTSQSADHGVNWTFNSGTQAFNFIPAGETLVLTYTIRARDSSGVAASRDDFQTVTVTITGTDDGITLVNDAKIMAENATGAARTGNVLTNDSVDPDFNEATQVTGFSVDANGDGTPENYLPGASVTFKAASGGTLGVFTLATNGAYSFTPNAANFSGTLPAITYTAVSPTAHTGTATLNITVTPVSDAPRVTRDAASINTAEDTSVALGFNAPTRSADTVDQNGSTVAGDNPERLGLITLSGIPSGAQLLYGASSFVSSGGTITILLSDTPAAQMIASPGAATLTMTRAQFEAMRVLPAADNATNFTVTMRVTEYEVDDAGNPLSGIAGATTSTTVVVDVRAVTDLVDLKIDGSDTSYSATISEDTPLNLTSLLSASFTDLDGSEQRSITFTNPLGNGTIYVNGHAVAGGASYTIAATDTGNSLETSQTGFPVILVTADSHFSGDLKGITVTLSARDTDADSTVTTLLQSNSVTLDLYVTPVADPVTVTSVTTPEDTAVFFLQGVALTDTDGSETLTGIAINALPADCVIRDNNGAIVFTGDGTTQYVVPVSAVTNGDFRNYTITPPAHSSADIPLSLSLTSTDIRMVNGVALSDTQTTLLNLTVTVTPVAEEVGKYTDADLLPDLTINPDHLYSAQGAEDDWFALKQDGEGFNPQNGWSNQDADEQTYALLTPSLSSGSAIGSQFSYTDAGGTTHVLTYTGNALRVPLAALDTVQFKAAANVAGTFEIKVQALTIDTDPNNGATVEAISGTAILTRVVIAPVADPVTLAVDAPAVGTEDSAIPLVIRPTSADPSETFTVTISGIPAGATISYGGVLQTVTAGSVSIANFSTATLLTITPPLNSNVDIPLSVSAVSIDTSGGVISMSPTTTLPLLVDVRGVADPVAIVVQPAFTTTEAAVDGGGRQIALAGVITSVAPLDNDGSEAVNLVVTGVPVGFSLQGLTFLGGVGVDRIWSGTPSQVAAASLVVRDANYSGTISFNVRAVSTENDGNNLSGADIPVSIAVSPSPEALLPVQTSALEDTFTPLNLALVPQNGDVNETLVSVWINAGDLAGKPFTLFLGATPLVSVLVADAGWYKLTAAQAATLFVQGAANSDADGSFAIKYEVRDPSSDGSVPATMTQFDGTHTISIAPVTDATLSTNDYAGGIINTTTVLDVKVTVTQQGDVNAGGTKDMDGSERLLYFIVDNVPIGVTVLGGRYIGNTPGNANTGRWILDTPDQAFTTDSVDQTIRFSLDGTSTQLSNLNQSITIIAHTQDTGGSERTSSTIWTLQTDPNFVDTAPLPGVPAASIDHWVPDAVLTMTEDAPTNLGALIDAQIDGTSPYAITITGLPAGSVVSGMMQTVIGGQTIWTVQGAGDNASLQAVLAGITITPPANWNANQGAFSFSTTLTTYDDGGGRNDVSAILTPPVTPVSDAIDLITSTAATLEDSAAVINLALSNPEDGAAAQVFNSQVYLRLDESAMTPAGGTLTYGGQVLVSQFISGVSGVPDGTYYVVTGVSSTDALAISYQGAANASGTVGYTAYVQGQESGASNVTTSQISGSLVVAPDNDGVVVAAPPVVSNEDTAIPVSINVALADASETIYSVTLTNVPPNFLVYVGGVLASNLSGGVWGIPVTNNIVPANIVILPTKNWSGNFTANVQVWSGEPDLDPVLTTTTLPVTVNGVADGIGLTPTLSFGDEGRIVALNLNSVMPDHDGSETASLTIKNLGEHAAFYAGTSLLAATYDGGSDTYTLSNLTPAQVTGLGVIQKDGDYTLAVTAHTHDTPGNDDSTIVNATLQLNLSAVSGTSGNDTLLYDGNALNGLLGVDTVELRLGENLDFATDLKPTNIERLDLMPVGQDHSLSHLTIQDVLDMTDSGKTLAILGDSGDSVSLKDGSGLNHWAQGGTEALGGHVFDVYTNAFDSAVKVLIEQQINKNIDP